MIALCVCMHLDQRIHLKQVWRCGVIMASLLLTTAILNLKSLAEEKLFLYISPEEQQLTADCHCRPWLP